ncbi:hypothetical protein N1851_009554 [Merluccius polli]|uniref:Uncharacterized protein n=1 Tax=Merluccius polli TaxID=89951 RepID=A0AA47N0W8_MERPO|nr:hypothetical protein N1851_009554 [Merluccius polli]
MLGYICNESRHFYVYISNRVEWQYVPTDENPADVATRYQLTLRRHCLQSPPEGDDFELVNPFLDIDNTFNTTVLTKRLESQHFSTFSSWKSLTHAIACLTHIAQLFQES